VYWYGPASNHQVEALEQALGVELPDSYREFLMLAGGGGGQFGNLLGIVPSGIRELEDGEILHVTQKLRAMHALPPSLVPVVRRSLNQWLCIETNRKQGAKRFAIFAFSTTERAILGEVATNYRELFGQYTLMHVSDPLAATLFLTTSHSVQEVLERTADIVDGELGAGSVDADTFTIQCRSDCKQGSMGVGDSPPLQIQVVVETSVLPIVELNEELTRLAAELTRYECDVSVEALWPAFLPEALKPHIGT